MSFATPAISGSNSPQMVSGASPYSSPTTKMTNLFQTIDTGNTGSISKQQFNNAFATLKPPGRFQSLGPTAIFSQLDPQGTGSVSKSAFVNVMSNLFNSSASATTGGTSANFAGNPSQSLSQSQASLERLGGSGYPGQVVNKQV